MEKTSQLKENGRKQLSQPLIAGKRKDGAK